MVFIIMEFKKGDLLISEDKSEEGILKKILSKFKDIKNRAKSEIEETKALIRILTHAVKSYSKNREFDLDKKDIEFIQGQSADVIKNLLMVTILLIPIPIPITPFLIIFGKKIGIDIAPKEHEIPEKGKKKDKIEESNMKIIITEKQYKILNESLVDDKVFRDTIKSFESTVTNSVGNHYTFDDKDPKNPKTFIKSKSPYGGVLTIGWGHTGTSAKPGNAISNKNAEDLLSQDISKEENKAKQIFPKYNTYPLYVQRAITNSVYRGEAKSGYEWVKNINLGKWKLAAEKYLEGWNIDFSKADDPKMKGSVAQRMKSNQKAFLKYADELKSGTTSKPETTTPKPKITKPTSWMDTMLSSVESTKIKSPSWMDSMLSNIENISKNLTTYVVKSGDTLSKIAAKYDKTVTVDSIKKLNGLKSDSISAGQKLKIK